MIFKYDFSISGDNFFPEKIIDKIQGGFTTMSFFSPKDKKKVNENEEYGFGSMSFWHPKKFTTEERISEYENSFIEFIEINYNVFIEYKVTDLQILVELFYDGGQCNFEIFSKDLLKRLVNFGVSIPVSIYVLEEDKLVEWENEIRKNWEG